MTEERQGWHPDPFGRHESRYFSAGHPTFLVRDGFVEGSDPVEDIPPQVGPQQAEAEVGLAAEWLVPEQRAHGQHVDWIANAASPVAPPRPSVPPDVARESGRHGTRSSRAPLFAAAAVVCVVGVIAVAIAASRQHRSSPVSASSASTVSASPINSPAVDAGVLVASTGGHFAARFPSTPIQQSVSQTIEGVQVMIHVALVRTPVTEVSEEDLAGDVPTNEQAVALRSAIAVAAAAATDGSPTQQADTTFRGKPARTSTFALPSGEQVTAIAFFQDARTVYFLLADAGAPIEALSASVQFGSASSPPVLS